MAEGEGIANNQHLIVTESLQEASTQSLASAFAVSHREGLRPRNHSTSSLESQLPIQSTQVHFRTLSEETTKQTVITFLKVPVRDASPSTRVRSLSLSSTRSGDISSPLFTPRRRQRLRSQCSDSEDDGEHETKDDTEDSSSELQSDYFRSVQMHYCM